MPQLTQYWTSQESDRQMSKQCKKVKTVWSFCRFLHFITTKGRRNPTPERSKVVYVELSGIIQPV
ncbi:MAG: hypothetical protein JO235_10890 [Chroococcidiopsidaceae cyanobacterium CP_BM_RX_35]|nr:hypothetical protein [Chroococcidiopsidaceae cyanobacterium CP_BM_RX_35]